MTALNAGPACPPAIGMAAIGTALIGTVLGVPSCGRLGETYLSGTDEPPPCIERLGEGGEDRVPGRCLAGDGDGKSYESADGQNHAQKVSELRSCPNTDSPTL